MNQIEIPNGWNKEKIGDIIESISLTGKKIKNCDYQQEGKLPIIDQGKELIGGYTSNSKCKIHVDKPLVIFGDHTRIVKYVDFDFAPGADGTKVLKMPEKIVPKYFYYFLKSIKLENKGYSRHYKILKQNDIIFPENKNIQQKIVRKLDYILGQFEEKKKGIMKLDDIERMKKFQKNSFNKFLDDVISGKFTSNLGSNQQKETENQMLVENFIEIQNGYAFKSNWFTEHGIRLVRNINVGHGRLSWENKACISEERSKDFDRFLLSQGDILISLDRPIISTGLKLVKVSKYDLPCLLLQRVGKFVFKNKKILPEFFYFWLQSSQFLDRINPGRSSGVPHISTKEIKKLSFNPPSILEQKQMIELIQNNQKVFEKTQSIMDETIKLKNQFKKNLGEFYQTLFNLAFSGKLVN